VTVEIRDARFAHVVGDAPVFEALADGYGFLEGPVWDAPARRLVFSDIPGDAIHHWSEAGGARAWRVPSRMSNGLALDDDGRLVCCEHATSRVTRLERDGRVTVIASAWQGRELNSPNDVVIARDGAVWFTDPTYGRMAYYGVAREPVLGHRGVYRAEPDGSRLDLLAGDFAQPNGLCFSLDGQRLFVNDTERMHVRAFDLRDDGTLEGGVVWAVVDGEGAGAPDGMKLDRDGNLWCTGPGGIHVFDPNARCLGVLHVPTPAANFAFGDDDRRSLFVAATSTLWRVRVRTPGAAAT